MSTTVTVTDSCPSTGVNSIFIAYNPSVGTFISTVNDGQSYAAQGTLIVTGASVNGILYALPAAASGSHAILVTFSGNTQYFYIVAICVGGAGGIDGGLGFDNNFAGTAPNAVVGGSVTTSTSGDAVLGFFLANTAANLSVGTTPATFTSLSFTTSSTLGEQLTQGSAGSIAAHATSDTNTDIIGWTLAVTPSGGSSSQPQLMLMGVGR